VVKQTRIDISVRIVNIENLVIQTLGSNTLANSSQARKRARQAEKRRQHNSSQRSMLRTYIKKVVSAIDQGDKEKAQAAYKAAVPVIDHIARKGLIHANKAARHKSRLNQHIRNLQP